MDEKNNHESCHEKSMEEEEVEEALEEAENSKPNGKIVEKIEDCDDIGCDEQWKQVNSIVDDSSNPVAGGISTRASSPSGTLTAVASASSDLHCDFEVPLEYALKPSVSPEEFKDKVDTSKQADQIAPDRTQNQQEPTDDPLSSELLPTSVKQSIVSIPSPSLPEQSLSTAEHRHSSCMPEVEKQNSFGASTLSVVPVQKTPSPDGYNWRKYGQKQVKSPQGSRSYYRCTYSDCYAKKIECSDESNRVIEIVYRSRHNHDPPRKVNCTRGSKLPSSVVPVNGIDTSVHAIGAINFSLPSTSSKDPAQETPPVLDSIGQESSGTDENLEIDVKPEHVDEPEPRKRLKKSVSSCSGSLLKPGKKPKFVVHATGDVGTSGDGFRWRKYGQKMVKGTPHPRNYYRCTSAGCPVRKHIERAKDNTTAVIITYKGRHDHDMPVPKKRHGPPSAPLLAAAGPASMNTLPVMKSEPIPDQVSATRWSVDREGELTGQTLELGGEKAMGSTGTLLSIGFEIKPC